MRFFPPLLVLCACNAGYGVSLEFTQEETRNRTSLVEVALVRECPAENGADAANPIRELSFGIDESPTALGDAAPGNYGLYARAIDENCNIVAAGCTPVSLEGGGDGELPVVLSPVSRSLCAASEVCIEGLCVDTDGGTPRVDGSVDAVARDAGARDSGADVLDAGPDAVDAGTDVGPDASDGGSDAGPADPLVAHYACEGNVQDSSGNGHNASCVGLCPVFEPGVLGQACAFGTTGYLEVSYDDDFDPTNGVSASIWVRLDAESRFTSAVGMPVGSANSNTWQIYFELLVATFVSDHTIGGFNIQRAGALRADEWEHIVITYDGDVKSIYTNGVLQTMETHGPIVADGQALTIGADRNGGVVAHRLTGDLDEVKIFNRALTQEEVAELFTEL